MHNNVPAFTKNNSANIISTIPINFSIKESHLPDLGRKVSKEEQIPKITNIKPKPMAKKKRAKKPKNTFFFVEIKSKVAPKTGVVQGVIKKPPINPKIKKLFSVLNSKFEEGVNFTEKTPKQESPNNMKILLNTM